MTMFSQARFRFEPQAPPSISVNRDNKSLPQHNAMISEVQRIWTFASDASDDSIFCIVSHLYIPEGKLTTPRGTFTLE